MHVVDILHGGSGPFDTRGDGPTQPGRSASLFKTAPVACDTAPIPALRRSCRKKPGKPDFCARAARPFCLTARPRMYDFPEGKSMHVFDIIGRVIGRQFPYGGAAASAGWRGDFGERTSKRMWGFKALLPAPTGATAPTGTSRLGGASGHGRGRRAHPGRAQPGEAAGMTIAFISQLRNAHPNFRRLPAGGAPVVTVEAASVGGGSIRVKSGRPAVSSPARPTPS